MGPRRPEWFEGLPNTSENTLAQLIGDFWSETVEVERATNSQGRRVEGTIDTGRDYICEQLRYETVVLPLAKQYDWPTHIDFELFLKRICSSKILEILVMLYKDPWHGILINDGNTNKHKRTIKSLTARTRREIIACPG